MSETHLNSLLYLKDNQVECNRTCLSQNGSSAKKRHKAVVTHPSCVLAVINSIFQLHFKLAELLRNLKRQTYN